MPLPPQAGIAVEDAPSMRALTAWRTLELAFDRAFGSRANPLRQLGGLAFLVFWLLAVSGIWLYAVLDTSASGAHASIAALSRAPWSLGGLMRSLHRYAADAFVVFTALHLLRETLHGRWRHFRRFSWLTGAALLPLLAVSAVGGFWINWDRLGQFSAIATTEWLDAWPIFASPLARNFIGVQAVNDRLFSLFVFVHLGVPLLLVFGLWFHIQRITRAAVFPPRVLAIGTLVVLLLLALAWPVQSQAPADLATEPQSLSLDWLLLFVHPFMYATSAELTWALTLGPWLLLLALPWVPPLGRKPAAARAPIAVVDAGNCNGCQRCFADCPYAAVTMVPHPNQRIGRLLAVVDADLCAGCGICAGACPSSTPFRSTAELVTGIDMPQLTVGTLRRQLRDGLAVMPADRQRLVIYSCAQGADAQALAGDGVLVLPLICTGQLPPSFVEYALRDGADGVLVASCRDGGCAYRLGARWTAERLAGQREPHLRASVAGDHVRLVEADAGELRPLKAALSELRIALNQIKAAEPAEAKISHG